MGKIFQCLKSVFEKNENPSRSEAMQAYMRGQFVFLGLSSPTRRTLQKDIFSEFKNYDWAQVEEFISECWAQDAREYKYAAMDYAGIFQKKYTTDQIPFFEKLIGDQSWWDTVDLIASGLIGKTLLRYPESTGPIAMQWIKMEPFWYPRSALILQLFFRERTDFELLKKLILRTRGSREFFINKAAGWALRQYSKTDPKGVSRFLSEIKLHPLTVREASKYLH